MLVGSGDGGNVGKGLLELEDGAVGMLAEGFAEFDNLLELISSMLGECVFDERSEGETVALCKSLGSLALDSLREESYLLVGVVQHRSKSGIEIGISGVARELAIECNGTLALPSKI